MTEPKPSKGEDIKAGQQSGLSTSDIIKMSEEIGADWLKKQSEKKVGQKEEDKENDKEHKKVTLRYSIAL